MHDRQGAAIQHVAKVGVVGSNPIARSIFSRAYLQSVVTGANFRAPLPLHVIMTGRDG